MNLRRIIAVLGLITFTIWLVGVIQVIARSEKACALPTPVDDMIGLLFGITGLACALYAWRGGRS